MRYAEVAVAAPIDQTLTYSLDITEEYVGVPSGINIDIGRRVLVPLQQRRVTGYIVDTSDEAQTSGYSIRKIIKYLDPQPLFHEAIIPFYKWISDYYHYPLGLVIKAALPGGLVSKSVKKLAIKSSPEDLVQYFNDKPPEWATMLHDKKELSQKDTLAVLKKPENRQLLSELQKKNIIHIISTLSDDLVKEKKEICYAFSKDISFPLMARDIDDIADIKNYQGMFTSNKGYKLKVSELKTLFAIDQLRISHNIDHVAVKDIRKFYPGASKPLQSLLEKGLLEQSQKRIFRSPFGEQLRYYDAPESLTREQQCVLKPLTGALLDKKFSPFLLHGVTGSGKTEIYLKAAEKALELDRDVLILVPEIGLATALEAHFISRFGDQVVLLHSGMTQATRFDQYSLALQGKARIVIGARSAVFAPLKDPGLIVVDEEHDQGFKQDDSFRYNGRDLAIVRAKIQNSVVILGSATPSVTSYANAQQKKYHLLSMENRIGEARMPKVNLVDLNSSEAKQDKFIIKRFLREQMEQNLAQEKQTILLINRRGFSTAVICKDCGTPVQCNHCHVSLTFHQAKKRLICHYCGFSVQQETTCAECRSGDLAPVGVGSERVEQEVQELFPEASVKRIDSDVAANRKKLQLILQEMHERKIDILIGTQMIAKGHHFPNVTLVGVVWADGGMNIPDFRAAERTFQLITQVTGRAGRGKSPGKVVIQTMRPDHYSIDLARKHDYYTLYEHEMKLRKAPQFPPYVRLAAIHLKGPVENRVKQCALDVAKFCKKTIGSYELDIVVLGPAPSPLDKIKDNYRWQLLLKGLSSEPLKRLCSLLRSKHQDLVQKPCSLIIDVDPENLM